jgi:hypothetical protein
MKKKPQWLASEHNTSQLNQLTALRSAQSGVIGFLFIEWDMVVHLRVLHLLLQQLINQPMML